ncbi:sterol-sensing domain of SREBP cleavage-activation-domain-containing protein [Phlyctochytrium arcticum]|nr:sterol-sensing domain of SREBP cleavage-activation-domain-containing protein [Phlyctochytrium arcticum]
MSVLFKLRQRLVALGTRADAAFSRLFYRHGLFCASYPLVSLSISFALMFILSYPIVTQLHNTLTEPKLSEPMQFWEISSAMTHVDEEKVAQKYGHEPFLHLEQIVISVNTSTDRSGLEHGVLDKRILQFALDLQLRMTHAVVEMDGLKYRLQDICYKPPRQSDCLIHSPLEYWGSNITTFDHDLEHFRTLTDTSVLSSLGIPIPLHSVFGGISVNASTGALLSAQSMVLSFFLVERKDDNSRGIGGLDHIWDKLLESVVTQSLQVSTTTRQSDLPLPNTWRAQGDVKHLYYEFTGTSFGLNSETLVLAVMYLIVFFYISLVVGKVDLVKSKFALGFGAVVTVCSGLTMSVGVCSTLGVKTSLVPWEVLPFLIIIVGVENIFVVTNAVVMTSIDLPVKERVGQGLGKVGVSMSISLGGEMLLLLLSSTMNIPAVQDFCLFGAISIVMDYLMQITFFITILSIDIRRLELSELHKLTSLQTGLGARRPSLMQNSGSATESAEEDTTSGTTRPRRPHWAGYLMILGTITVLGFGLYGSSIAEAPGVVSETIGIAQPSLPLANTSTLCENTMCATVDAFWHVIDPDRSAKYLEIRPPTHIIFGGARPESGHAVDEEASQKFFPLQDYIASGSSIVPLFLHDLHPTLFILIIVVMLLVSILFGLSLSSVLLWLGRLPRSVRRRNSFGDVDSLLKHDIAKRWTQPYEILEIFTGSKDDVLAVKMVESLVAWISSSRAVLWATVGASSHYQAGFERGRATNVELCMRNNSSQFLIAAVSDAGEIKVWLNDGTVLVAWQSGKREKFSQLQMRTMHDKLVLCAGGHSGLLYVFVWDVNASSFMTTTPSVLEGHESAITTLLFTECGDILSGSEDTTLRCWSPFDGHQTWDWSLRYTFYGHDTAVCCITANTEEDLIVTGTTDGQIYIWDQHAKKPVAKILASSKKQEHDGSNDTNKGHAASVTMLRLSRQITSNPRALKYVLCSAGADERLNFWRLTLTSDSPRPSNTTSATRSRSLSNPTKVTGARSSLARRDSLVKLDGYGGMAGGPTYQAYRKGSGDAGSGTEVPDVECLSADLQFVRSIRQPGCVTAAGDDIYVLGVPTIAETSADRDVRSAFFSRWLSPTLSSEPVAPSQWNWTVCARILAANARPNDIGKGIWRAVIGKDVLLGAGAATGHMDIVRNIPGSVRSSIRSSALRAPPTHGLRHRTLPRRPSPPNIMITPVSGSAQNKPTLSNAKNIGPSSVKALHNMQWRYPRETTALHSDSGFAADDDPSVSDSEMGDDEASVSTVSSESDLSSSENSVVIDGGARELRRSSFDQDTGSESDITSALPAKLLPLLSSTDNQPSIPVLRIDALAVSSVGIAIGFGSKIKIIVFRSPSPQQRGDRKGSFSGDVAFDEDLTIDRGWVPLKSGNGEKLHAA